VYSTFVAYLLWLFSGFGALGFHRFYLNKFGTGILFIVTGGIFGLGSLYDLFTLPAQVREANLRIRYRDALLQSAVGGTSGVRPAAARESIEKTILRTAKKNKGRATPAEVALEGDVPIEQAKRDLDKLVSNGHAEMRVTKNGTIVYVFPDFAGDMKDSDLEDF
jgi:TM2 domain-containing membrane protein YozV